MLAARNYSVGMVEQAGFGPTSDPSFAVILSVILNPVLIKSMLSACYIILFTKNHTMPSIKMEYFIHGDLGSVL